MCRGQIDHHVIHIDHKHFVGTKNLLSVVLAHKTTFNTSQRFFPLDTGERGAQPNAGLNVTRTFYIVRQDQAGCVSAIFLLLPEDGLPPIWRKFLLYFVKILDKECFDIMKVNFFIIDFFFGL